DLERLRRPEAIAPRRERLGLGQEVAATRVVGHDQRQAQRAERAETGEGDHATDAIAFADRPEEQEPVVEVATPVLLGRHLQLPALKPPPAVPDRVARRAVALVAELAHHVAL